MKRLITAIGGWPLWVKLIVVTVTLGLIATIILTAPQVAGSFDQVVSANPSSTGDATASPTPSESSTANPSETSGSTSNSGSSHGHAHGAPCDIMSKHGTIPDECTAGYKAPQVVFDSVSCEPAVTAGTFTITLMWKTVGGNFTTASVMSRNSDGELREKWLLAGVTPETVILDGDQVRVRFGAMNGEPGYIDYVKSEPTGHVVAADICALG